jgi:transcriptional antiterminator NusG
MLGKVDELAVNTDTRSIPSIGETIKVVDGPLMVSMVLKKINEESVNEVKVKIFGRKHH